MPDITSNPSLPPGGSAPWRRLITPSQRAELLANGARIAAGQDIDPHPVVKLFTPDANATWLLADLDPQDPDRAFGLCDLGFGEPELGHVLLSEIAAVRGRLGLHVERDRAFKGNRPVSHYAEEARHAGRVTA